MIKPLPRRGQAVSRTLIASALMMYAVQLAVSPAQGADEVPHLVLRYDFEGSVSGSLNLP